ncbi:MULTISPECIES: glycoside transferase [Listeria]|uniref:glycoside transferase n=1 Tax=Listeria TaxID=1637 RepID=UPI000B58DD27|nr:MULTISPECIES: glycoside transferase [Listeria]
MFKKLFLLTLIAFLAGCAQSPPKETTPKKANVEKHVATNYLAENGLIADYKVSKNANYLSESIGLYMQYLVLNNDSQTFHSLFTAMQNELLTEQTFIKWKMGNGITTNAFIDDMRIYEALQAASDQFNYPPYADFANKIAVSWKKYGLGNQTPRDFFDFKTKEKAKTLHLSYYNSTAMKEAGFDKAAFKPLENAVASPFFDEIFQDGRYETTGNEVNMIDQMLIAIQYVTLTHKKEPHFDAFLQSEWEQNNRVYARFYRDTKEPVESIESTAVYAMLTEYYTQTNQPDFYQKAMDKLNEMDTSNATTTHFFDYMHKELALIKKDVSR